MGNSTPLEKSVLEELQRTGYPTEIVSASIMQQHGWEVIHNPSYLDDTEGLSREYDILSQRQWSFKVPNGSFITRVHLITECKKSEKPWVFFVTPENHEQDRLGALIKGRAGDKQIFTNRYHQDAFVSDKYLRSLHHYFQRPSLARTFHEPMKRQERSDHAHMIYSAVMSVIKSTLFYHFDRPYSGILNIWYPLIIFSGHLFEATVDANKAITLTPSNHTQLSFHYMLPSRSRDHSVWENYHQFIIDIVHENHLTQFLTMITAEHSMLSRHLQDTFESK